MAPLESNTRVQHASFALASLIAGTVLLLNLDRTLHQASARELGYQASQHGWPLVYLERTFEQSVPNHLRFTRRYDWPWPTVAGEQRRWDYQAMLIDALTLVLLVAATFRLVQWFGYRIWKPAPC